MDMATRIRVARRSAGLTQSELAERIGVTRGAVANWEISTRPKPSLGNLVVVATATGVSFEWVATGRGDILFRE